MAGLYCTEFELAFDVMYRLYEVDTQNLGRTDFSFAYPHVK